MYKIAILFSIAMLASGCASLDGFDRHIAYLPSSNIQQTPAAKHLSFSDQWMDSPAVVHASAGTVHGWWIPQLAEDAPAVLYLHGNAGNISNDLNLGAIQRLHQAGFAVLAIDYRGYGESAKVLPDEATVYADARVGWERLLNLSPRANSHLIYGHSLGAAVAIEVATTESHLDVLIVEGSYTSFADVAGRTEFGLFGLLPLSSVLSQKFDSRNKIGKIKVPKLFVHGELDAAVPVEMGKELFDLASEPKFLLLVPDGHHRDSAAVAGTTWVTAVQSIANK